jgi:hypothetical protein
MLNVNTGYLKVFKKEPGIQENGQRLYRCGPCSTVLKKNIFFDSVLYTSNHLLPMPM